MGDRSWYRNGPSVFGYQPGWLWWAAALVVVAGGGAWLAREIQRRAINDQYIADRVEYHANVQGLDVELVKAVVEAESGGDWNAQSGAGAKGLMQVTRIAHEDVLAREAIGEGDLFDPDYNLQVGTIYLRHQLARFDGDLTLAIAAYHMGPTAVAKGRLKYPDLAPRDMIQKHAGPQTRAYVDKVLQLYQSE